MKKRTLNLIILAAVLVVAIVVAVVIYNANNNDDMANETVTAEGQMIDIVPDTDAVITNIAYTNEYGDYSFTLADGVWMYDADNEFPIGQDYINAIVTDIGNLAAYRDITEEAGADSEYGLDKPSVVLEATYDDGSSLEFIFGAYNESAMGYYMKHNSSIYIVGQGLLGDCSLDIINMIKTEAMATIDCSMINAVIIDGTEYTDEDMINAVMYKYQFINLNYVVDYKNPETYGFDGSEHTVVINYTTTNYETDENGEYVPVSNEREYKFSFTENDGMEYLIIDKAEGETELVYCSSAASALLDVSVDGTEGSISALPEIEDLESDTEPVTIE